MRDSVVHIGDNSHVVEVEDLKDLDGTVQTDATVTLTALTEKVSGDTVSNVTLPLTLTHVSSGLYRGVVPYNAGFEEGKFYDATIKAVGSQGYRAQWTETLKAKKRSV